MADDNAGGTVLIADDDPDILRVLTDVLESDAHRVLTCRDGRKALELVPEERPDVVLLDIDIPSMDGFEVLETIKEDPETYLRTPVVMITGQNDGDAKRRALERGADDFVTKPPEIAELKARVRSLVKVKAYHDSMRTYRKELESEVEQRTREMQETVKELRKAHEKLKAASFETTYRLARAAEFKDEDTALHIRRMSTYAATVARQLGEPEDWIEQLLSAAAMHDIGKIGVPEKVLLKPGKLTEAEWRIMKQHTTFGARILAESDYDVIQLGEVIARSHHEKWDGSGYPDGLVGRAIPYAARIVAVADVFDALTSKRPYKEAFPVAKALGILKDGRGSHFDPQVVDAFLAVQHRILEIKDELGDSDGQSITRRLNEALS